MRKALPSLFPNLLETTSNARAEFYDKFQREAEAHDRDFIKKYDEDLNTTLIFVSVFLFASALVVVIIWSFCAYRLAYSPQSQPLSFLTFRKSSNRITKN